MSRKDANESTEPLVGRLGAAVGRTARAARISRHAVKSCCAGEWGGWGQLSDDGPGQHNPDRSEGPWGRAMYVARMAVLHRAGGLRHRTGDPCCRGGHEGWRQT